MSCSPTTVFTSGAKTAVKTNQDDKTLGESWDDATIKLGIKEKYFSYDATLFTKIDVEVELGVDTGYGLDDIAKDKLISTQLVAKIFADKYIKKFKYNIEVQKQIVYLFGVSNDQAEIDRVIDHAKSIKGVVDIINYIEPR